MGGRKKGRKKEGKQTTLKMKKRTKKEPYLNIFLEAACLTLGKEDLP